MCNSFGYLWNKSLIQFQFSGSRLWCVLQHSLFLSLAARLPVYTFFFHYLGKMTEGNTKDLLLFPGAYWQRLICISEFIVRHIKVVDSSLLYAFSMPTPHTTHLPYSCLSFRKETGSFCNWDKIRNGVARAL